MRLVVDTPHCVDKYISAGLDALAEQATSLIRPSSLRTTSPASMPSSWRSSGFQRTHDGHYRRLHPAYDASRLRDAEPQSQDDTDLAASLSTMHLADGQGIVWSNAFGGLPYAASVNTWSTPAISSLDTVCGICDRSLVSLSHQQRVEHRSTCYGQEAYLALCVITPHVACADGSQTSQPVPHVSVQTVAYAAPTWRMWANHIPASPEEWRSDRGVPGDEWSVWHPPKLCSRAQTSRWDLRGDPADSGWVPPHMTPGVVDVIMDCLIKSSHSSSGSATIHAKLSRDATHFAQGSLGDLYSGCRFRATLAIVHVLQQDPLYSNLFNESSQGAQPGFRRMQGWLEQAWRDGFYDPEDPPRPSILRDARDGFSHWDTWAMLTWLGIE